MPELLFSKEETYCKIKYIGGLNILLVFDNSVEAKEFKETDCRWKDNLKWLKWGDQSDVEFITVAWIRTVGLHLNLWGDQNFEAISIRYGVKIAPYDNMTSRVYLTCAKIGILIYKQLRINEEISVIVEGNSIKFRAIEFDEDWFPFWWDPTEDYYEK